jgi:1-acyl-sn-glycerol-3-phosphate acyltransferase
MVTADEVKGLQGWFIRRLGGFPVNVRGPSVASLRHGIDLLEQESMLVIFPEGGIFKDGQVHRLKPGLARLAVQAESIHPSLGVKVLPVSLRYSDVAVGWRSAVDVVIGQPLEVASYMTPDPGSDRLKASAKHLTTDLTAALTQLSDQQGQH